MANPLRPSGAARSAARTPSISRDIDGSYVVMRHGERIVVHVELHRRHQSFTELATDVAEAQIRLHRREGLRVLSLVWDLYGKRVQPLFEEQTWTFGVSVDEASRPSRCSYRRVNLRALTADEVLSNAPPVLWPLVALTGDGATEGAVLQARDAIQGRVDLPENEKADHLAILWFVSEAEDVPTALIRRYLTEEKLMESSLYRSAIEKGEARGTVATLAKVLVRG